MKFQPYPKYKDSGVEWLGEVPSGWKVKRLKFCASEASNKVQARGSESFYIGMENIESWTGRYIPSESEVEGISNSFKAGNVLFGKLRPYLAKAFLTDFNGLCSSEFLVLNAKQVMPKYLIRYILSYEFINQVDSSTYGTKMPRANWEFIGDLPIPIPTILEQNTITNFLDRETRRIDALVEEKNHFIELLKEKRQALISQAVTKGLDPAVKMKDSGVEWLGDVPDHWTITKLGFITSKIGSGKTPKGGSEVYSEQRVLFVRSQNVYDTGLMLDDIVYIDNVIDESRHSAYQYLILIIF